MSDPAPKPPKLPVEAAGLPFLDALAVAAICAGHRRSLLRRADRPLGRRRTTQQITHLAERWPRNGGRGKEMRSSQRGK